MIRIPKEVVERIGRHGEETYPEECCGIVLGQMNDDYQLIEEIVGLDNEQKENRGRRFFVTPKQYLQAERMALERKLDLLGFYHSHPDHPAAPSEFDREHALPWFIYVVVSIAQGKSKDTTAWLLSEGRDRFVQKELVIEEEVDSK